MLDTRVSTGGISGPRPGSTTVDVESRRPGWGADRGGRSDPQAIVLGVVELGTGGTVSLCTAAATDVAGFLDEFFPRTLLN